MQGLFHGFDRSGGMLPPHRVEEKVIGQNSWFDSSFSHHHNPWPHEKTNEAHGERASLRDGAGVGVFNPKGSTNLLPDREVIDEGFVGFQNVAGHPCLISKFDDKSSDYLIEAFKNIDTARGNLTSN